MVSYIGLIFWWIEIRFSIDNCYKGFGNKGYYYILNWDIVEKRPRSGVKFINHNKKASETWVKLHWNVKAMA